VKNSMNENILLDVKDLSKFFPVTRGFFNKAYGYIKAVNNISFQINKGQTLGLAGESGCGKTTAGKVIIRLLEPTSGRIMFHLDNKIVDMGNVDKKNLKSLRKKVAMIFQDPTSSLNPRFSVKEIIADPLIVHKIAKGIKLNEIVTNLIELVGLKASYLKRYPHEFSGGQKQRIGVARALVLEPKLIIADEPVSSLDISIQAQILTLLKKLQKKLGFACLFISHDLRVIKHMSDVVAIMYLGKVVELAEVEELYWKPKHPYTEALLSAIPVIGNESRTKRILLKGNVPNPLNVPSGCQFHPRCPYAIPKCAKEEPIIQKLSVKDSHLVSCHLAKELNLKGVS